MTILKGSTARAEIQTIKTRDWDKENKEVASNFNFLIQKIEVDEHDGIRDVKINQ